MNAIIDHGHEYELLTLDGDEAQILRFVKRESDDPLKFPGNKGSHSGTTIQSVLRVLHSRISFLDSQHHCEENVELLTLIRRCNWLLEKRAADRHGLSTIHNEHEAIDAPMCPQCGHVQCNH